MSQGYTKGIPIDIDGTFSANSDALVPSQKAVKTYTDTGLATKQATLTGNELILITNRLLLKQNTSISHTGTTAQTVVFTDLIPAGTFEANDFFNWHSPLNATSNANNKTCAIYFNTVNNLTGSPILVATRTVVSVSGIGFKRTLAFNNSITSQKIMQPSAIVTTDEAGSVSTSLVSIDFTVNQYFIVAFTLANAGDTISLEFLRTWLNR